MFSFYWQRIYVCPSWRHTAPMTKIAFRADQNHLNMVIQSSQEMAIMMFALTVTILEIFAIAMSITLTLVFKMKQYQM